MIKPNLFFPTPVWTLQIDNYKNVNEEMHTYIKELQNKDQIGISKSNLKGWHSKDFNLNERQPQNFISLIYSSIEQVMHDMNWDKQKQIAKINNMLLYFLFLFLNALKIRLLPQFVLGQLL